MKKNYLGKTVATFGLALALLFPVCTHNSWAQSVDSSSAYTVSESSAEDQTASAKTWTYTHDPRDNAKAMADIVENPDAVYGFSPDPNSKRLGEYASYDWTDPEVVAKGQADRIAYEKSFDTMREILRTMRAQGKSVEEMARAVSEERNNVRLASYKDDPAGLERVKKSNLETYGNENGPTPEYLYNKYGSWELVIQHSFSMNMGMDACLGLYDQNYPLYQELGLVE